MAGISRYSSSLLRSKFPCAPARGGVLVPSLSAENKITHKYTPCPSRRLRAQTGPHPAVESEHSQRHSVPPPESRCPREGSQRPLGPSTASPPLQVGLRRRPLIICSLSLVWLWLTHFAEPSDLVYLVPLVHLYLEVRTKRLECVLEALTDQRLPVLATSASLLRSANSKSVTSFRS